VELFRNDDAGYERWLADNRAGYVLNTPENISPSSLVLHRADYQHIDITRGDAGRAGTQNFVKACSPKVIDLETWAAAQTGNGDLERCGSCEP
jgi:hypothetical protein